MLKKEIYDFYIPIIKKYKSLFFLMGVGGIISGTSSVLLPIFLKLETDQLVGKHTYSFLETSLSPFEVFVGILGIILLVDIFQTLLSSITNIFAQSKEDLLRNEIQLHLFEKMQHMEVGRTMSSRYKYISSIVESDFPSISRKIIDLPGGTLDFIIKLFGFTAVYIYFDITLLVVVIISSIIGYGIEIFSRKMRAKYDVDWKFTLGRQVRKYSNLFLYQFSQLAISGGLLSTLENYGTLLTKENKNTQKRNFSDLVFSIQNLLNNNLRDIILKLIVGYGVFRGTQSVGMVVLVVSSMGSMGEMISKIFSLKPAYKDFLFQQESILLMLKICTPAGTKDFRDKIEHVSIRNLSFCYPNMAKYEKEYMEILQKNIIGKDLKDNRLDKQIKELIEVMSEESQTTFPLVFGDINLEFQKGKVYGIVGKNGAGKTTLMYLLSGFFRQYTGSICFNGKPSEDFTTESFLQKVSFLTQVPFVLDWMSDIEENLFLGVQNEEKEKKAWEYLEKFGLHKKIKKHKKQLKAEIGSDIEFSGGEKQLIAFIRLLLQDRDIIILDEGTNQLDAENEVLVMKELLAHKKDKIIIFITHRMSTISKADEIFCLEDGKITASGNHKELLSGGENAYARFYKTQVLHEGAL